MARKYALVGPDDLEEVEKALKKRRAWRDRQRLKAIRLGVLGQSTMEEVAAKVGVSRATIGTWSQLFREGGIEAVLRTAFEQRGRKARLSEAIQEELKKRLRAGSFKRAKELRAWLGQEHGINLSLEGTYYWLGKVGGVLKVPRKTHVKKDAAKAEAFKSELANRLAGLGVPAEKRVRVWMVDEHRYGLISVLRKVWTLRGHQPTAPYQTKYEWGHLYTALEVDGENASEFFFSPSVSLELSDHFLHQLAASDPDAHHVVIWDGAGFHQKPGLHPVPDRVHLLQLPAYSPELNPVEKFFDQLKDEIGNRLFQTLDQIEAAIGVLLIAFWEDTTRVRSLIGQGWLLAQTNSSSRTMSPVNY